MSALQRHSHTAIGRPLKVLIPLIRTDIERGERAGMEYYADAGLKLIEARKQITSARWTSWLRKTFDIAESQASVYMRAARLRDDNGADELPESLREMTGATKRDAARRASERKYRKALRDLDTDLYAKEKQTRDVEVDLHRDIALELIDVGYKALATRLHPDRGGSKDAMTRLNRVREELDSVAKTRRFQ